MRAALFSPTLLTVGLALAACSSDPSTDPGDAGLRDSGASDSGSPDSGPSDSGPSNNDGGSLPSGEALLDRTVDRRFTCSVAAPATSRAPRQWTNGGHALAARDGQTVLVRAESMPAQPFEPAPSSLIFGALEADGSLASTTETLRSPVTGSKPAVVALADAFLFVWSEETKLYSAVSGASGTTAPHELVGNTGPNIDRVVLVAGHDGAAVVFTTLDYTTGLSYTSTFLRLDASGNQIGASKPLVAAQAIDPALALAATAEGWALVHRRANDVAFTALALDGTPGEAKVLQAEGTNWLVRSTGFDSPRIALLATASGFLAAWTEAKVEGDNGDYSAIRLARLAPDGALREAPIWVAAPIADTDDVEPRLSTFGSNVALTFARGAHIYICGGCIPSHSIQLVVFDPETMTPLSDLAALPPPAGGLLRRDEVWVGDTLRLAFEITFHVTADPGTGALRCTD